MSTNSSGANRGDVKQGSILHFGGVANRIVIILLIIDKMWILLF